MSVSASYRFFIFLNSFFLFLRVIFFIFRVLLCWFLLWFFFHLDHKHQFRSQPPLRWDPEVTRCGLPARPRLRSCWVGAFSLSCLRRLWCPPAGSRISAWLSQTAPQPDLLPSGPQHPPEGDVCSQAQNKRSRVASETIFRLTLTFESICLMRGCLGLISNVFFWLA